MSVTRVRPAGRDRYGDPIDGESELDLPGAFVAPRTSSDASDHGRNGAVIGLALYAPTGTDADRLIREGELVRTDMVRDGSTLYDIDGEVEFWTSPFGSSADGVEVALRRGEG
jgi:hypothetical protein